MDETSTISPNAAPAASNVASAPVAATTTTSTAPVTPSNDSSSTPVAKDTSKASTEATAEDQNKSWLDNVKKEEKPADATTEKKDETKLVDPNKPVEYKFKPVTGYEMPKEAVGELTQFAQSQKWSPEVAQAAHDALAAANIKLAQDAALKLQQNIAANREAFNKDPIYGGQNLEKSMAQGGKGYNAFRDTLTPPERNQLDGLMKDNHLAENNVIKKLLIFTGNALSEDSPRVDGTTTSGVKPSPQGFNRDAVAQVLAKRDAERAAKR